MKPVDITRIKSVTEARLDRDIMRARIGWVVLIGMAFLINSLSAYVTTVSDIKNNALYVFQKDVIYRRWATGHGGVYVPRTEQTPPNPFLNHIPERDIVTPSGKILTLINPAYMTRQVHEMGENEYGIRGHITSRHPIRPQNRPDAWEKEALLLFEQGVPEVFERTSIDGRSYFRFMRPFITEQGCLKCHAAQGYKVGDIRGGISLAIPWEPARDNLIKHLAIMFSVYLCIGIAGLWGIRVSSTRMHWNLAEISHAEKSMRFKNEELLSLHRMATHDLKAPIVTITTFLEFLKEDITAGDSGKAEESLQHIRVATDDMHALLDAMIWMSTSNHDSDLVVETTLQELVREALALGADTIKQRGVHIEVNETPVTLQGRPRHLVRVFQNLIDNAVKFMGDQPEPRIEIGCKTVRDNIYVFVRDNGMGIDSSADGKIFDVFTRAGSKKERSGLGLAIVKRIVEMHGGSIWVESQGLGMGSCFWFMLPDLQSER